MKKDIIEILDERLMKEVKKKQNKNNLLFKRKSITTSERR